MPNKAPFDVRLYISRTKNELEKDISMRDMGSYDYIYDLAKIDLCSELLRLLRFYGGTEDGKAQEANTIL